MKKTKKYIIMILIAFVCMLTNIIAFKYYLSKTINLKTTYIAKHDILPRQQIKTEDLIEIKVPEVYMQTNTWDDKTEIIGRYTSIQGMIPKGSLFYKDMIFTEDELKDLPITKLLEKNTIFTMETNVESLGSVVDGMYIDIYVSISQKGDVPITGTLIHHAELVSIKDHKGKPITSDDSTGIPSFIEIGMNRKDIDILSLACTLGDIRIFPSQNPYEVDESKLDEESKVTTYLKGIQEPNP
ncbi:MAG: SAF domain-containing protein [Erysipelotrichaceae bacterium]|nr:SAF domain-containing protein [Erysipelotrichaceae bacterium]MDY6034693.1 SAF domain-containing protein [Bulleidia sp.]